MQENKRKVGLLLTGSKREIVEVLVSWRLAGTSVIVEKKNLMKWGIALFGSKSKWREKSRNIVCKVNNDHFM